MDSMLVVTIYSMSWPKTLTGMKAVQKRFTKAAMTKQLMLFSNRGTGTFWISNT